MNTFLSMWRAYTGASSKTEQVKAQAVIEDALRADSEPALDETAEAIAQHAQALLDRLLSSELDASCDRLREASDFLSEHFSLTEPITPRGQRIPKGVMLTPEAKARGPLLALARSARELVPSVKKLLECQRLLDEVRAARQKDVERGAR